MQEPFKERVPAGQVQVVPLTTKGERQLQVELVSVLVRLKLAKQVEQTLLAEHEEQ